MEPERYHAVIARKTAELARAVRTHQSTPVPSCPGWTVGDLAVHVGVVHRWATEIVGTRATEAARGAFERWKRPADDPALADWLEAGAAALVDTLAASDPEMPVWAFVGMQPVRFWSRRQAHEVTIHAWDGASAAGVAPEIDADVAADGVDEALVVMGGIRRARSSREGHGETFHFHRTDGAGEWSVRFEGKEMTVDVGHSKADLAIRGGGADLMLFVWHRVGPERVELIGDATLVDRWNELLPPL